MTDPADLGTAQAARLIAAGELTSEALVTACLARISAREAAVREAAEETELDISELTEKLEQTGEYGQADKPTERDPRDNEVAWATSTAFKVHLPPHLAEKVVWIDE